MLNEKTFDMLKDDNNVNYSKPHDQIHVYHNMLGKSFQDLMSIIDGLDANSNQSSPISSWTDWGSSSNDENNSYIFGQQKRLDARKCIDNPDYTEIYRVLSEPIIFASTHYSLKHELEIGTLAPLSVSRYFEGKFMGPHTDSHESDERPTISVVMYLNDDYEGGELYFREQDVSIKAKHGDIVIFPSRAPFFHESKPVISGTKYICPGFWNKL